MEHINVLYGLLTDFLQDGELLPNMSEFMGIYGRVGSLRLKISIKCFIKTITDVC